jgi:prepilin-type N-terminal cleavage/methylation domain-containing protein
MNTSTRAGFTLVEMIVSVGLFAIVMLVTMTGYLALVNLERKARTTNDLVTNLTFVLDTMSRSMRTGTNFQCNGGGNCWLSPGESFTFVNDQNQIVTYRYDTTHHSIGQCVGGGACTDTTDSVLVDPRVTIPTGGLKFYVDGTSKGDSMQPHVTMTVKGTLTPDAVTGPVSFTIQTSASQRLLDI